LDQITASSSIRAGFGTLNIVDGTPNTVTFTAADGNSFYVELTKDVTPNAPASGGSWQRVMLAIAQDDTGSRLLTLGDNLRLGTDLHEVTLTTAASKTDYLALVWNPIAETWDVVAFIKGY